MVKLYFTPESYKKFKQGKECKACLDRIFDDDIEYIVEENDISKYSSGGFYAYLNIS